VLEQLAIAHGRVPVIMMTAHADVPMAVRAMQAGAADFVEKPFEEGRLVGSIERASAAGGPAAPAPGPALRARFQQLTPRELDVMRQLVIGHPNKVIGHNLGMSPRTVEIHRGRVMEKTGAESLSHLVRMAIRAGFDPDSGR
jgi:two-component system, LuxR family, response regulator FixJ